MYLIPLCIASSVANTGYTTHPYIGACLCSYW